VKNAYFIGDSVNGFEPIKGLLSVADGSFEAIGHLFACSLVNGGPGPNFLVSWVYHYLTVGITGLSTDLPSHLESDDIYQQVYLVYKFYFAVSLAS